MVYSEIFYWEFTVLCRMEARLFILNVGSYIFRKYHTGNTDVNCETRVKLFRIRARLFERDKGKESSLSAGNKLTNLTLI